MILEHFVCDRCEEELGPLPEGEDPYGWVLMCEPCEVHGDHTSQYCGWECAMHACAAQLDHQEHHEEVHREEDH